jgi:hypothetical protein
MAGSFDRLFGYLPNVMVRLDDGTAVIDRKHPAVKEFLQVVNQCREAGDCEDVIVEIVEQAFADHAARKMKEAKDGR